ncbi:hypothetical protein BCR36DRAFT_366445 [Piromyces finnis]|uniref:Uncharacterized protein n=1 Tax=Piromyces finnis TaxID=1754191 RepID=A0A1Y1VLG1_9FUNG|nr:hypothetical protein BCR36DRAFT_366445 [Piromyces finnis]|eukprot:ORX59262.1 hypothetical protein BCR36DRAFT_366445 [Piromyces finnis]
MNIIKYFILLLVVITKIDCSPHNHLDIQLSLLILSAGDHNGNIVKDIDSNYLKINISKNENKNEMKDIVDIIPSLRKIRDEENDINEKNKKIEAKFKELYRKAEKIAYDRLGHTYEYSENPLLFNKYNEKLEDMRDEFNNNVEKYDIFRRLNSHRIGLINSENDLSVYSFYRNDDSIENNKENFIKAITKDGTFTPEYANRRISNHDVDKAFRDVASQCNKKSNCKKLFENNKNLTYSLIKDNTENKLYFIVSNDKYIHSFSLELDEDENYKMNDYKDSDDKISLADINKKIKGYGKKSEILFKNGKVTEGYIESNNISIIADCGIILMEKDDNTIYNSDIYIVPGNDNKLSFHLYTRNLHILILIFYVYTVIIIMLLLKKKPRDL